MPQKCMCGSVWQMQNRKIKTGIIIHPDELSKRWVDRLAANGVDMLGIHPAGGKNAAATLAGLVEKIETPEFCGLINYAKQKGLEIEYRSHAAGYLLDRGYFAEHPEYFRENADGKRTADYNLCFSNESSLEIVAENAAILVDKLYGSRDVFYLWCDDIKDAWCHCENCRKLSFADQQLTLLNAMIKAIRKKRPQARLSYLAYQATIDVPASVKKEDGIFLEYAPFWKWAHRFQTDANYRTVIQREKSMSAPLIEYFGKEHSGVLEYWLDNSLFSGWTKPPKRLVTDAANIKKDVTEYAAEGFEEIATFGCYLGEDYETLYGEADISPFSDAVKAVNKTK